MVWTSHQSKMDSLWSRVLYRRKEVDSYAKTTFERGVVYSSVIMMKIVFIREASKKSTNKINMQKANQINLLLKVVHRSKNVIIDQYLRFKSVPCGSFKLKYEIFGIFFEIMTSGQSIVAKAQNDQNFTWHSKQRIMAPNPGFWYWGLDLPWWLVVIWKHVCQSFTQPEWSGCFAKHGIAIMRTSTALFSYMVQTMWWANFM